MTAPFTDGYNHGLLFIVIFPLRGPLSGDQIMRAEHFLHLLKSCLYLLACVGGHEAEADQCVIGSHSRTYHRIHKYTFLEKVACDGESLEVIADKERYDGS